MSVVRRLISGITDHFPIRRSEWGMTFAACGMAFVLNNQHDVFAISPAFSVLAQQADQTTWLAIVSIIAVVRVIALVVNGTFTSFRYSPHLRMFASILGFIFWTQYAMGIAIAAWKTGSSTTGIVAYGVFCYFEMCNTYQSSKDRRSLSK